MADKAYQTFQALLNEAQPNLRLLKTKKTRSLNDTQGSFDSNGGGGRNFELAGNATVSLGRGVVDIPHTADGVINNFSN